jgi:3'-phosphoadenosine 5'-phosphosulfate sulfotransferase (PAPS reductase)/FAD synthetase
VTTVLQFSGGKDSLACLYLLKPRWDEITVAWCNTGAAFPETIEQMRKVRELVPHFLEIKSKQTIATHGYPADLLPIASTRIGQSSASTSKTTFQSRVTCCASAIWIPMHQAMKDIGAKVIIRGQKRSDNLKAPIESGFTYDGIRIEFPIADWTDADVSAFLKREGVELPPNYKAGMRTGLDCWNCTAYLAENAAKLTYMRHNHPAKFTAVQAVLEDLREATRADTANLDNILKETITWA